MYSPGMTVVKTGTPLIIPVLIAAINAGCEKAGIDVPDTVVVWTVSVVYGLVVGVKNWMKNRKK